MVLKYPKFQQETPSEKFLIESVDKFISESKYPKKLLVKKLDLNLSQLKEKEKSTLTSITSMEKSLNLLENNCDNLVKKNKKELNKLKLELSKKV